MALLMVTQNTKMIDKLPLFICCFCLVLNAVNPAPAVEVTSIASTDGLNLTERALASESSSEDNSRVLSTVAMTTELSTARADEMVTHSPTESKGKLLQATLPTPMKSRKNKNDLFFCCSDDKQESPTPSLKRSKERERNTKAPVLKKAKNPDLEKESSFERRPALLLRFFPDGTAVLISKFQLHLHVKPKHIRLDSESDEDSDDDDIKLDPLEYDPRVLLEDGKGYEVTYKRLESIPSTREQNLYEPSNEKENEFSENYSSERDQHKDHELVTPTESTTVDTGTKTGRPEPIQESGTFMETTVATIGPVKVDIPSSDEVEVNKTEKITMDVGDSPFFMMTSGEMSSLQQQYDPVHAAPLKATTGGSQTVREQTTTTQPSTSPTTSTSTIALTTLPPTTTPSDTTIAQTEPTTTTTRKCLSFKTQVSLALSTEDNIDNSLLKKQILPTEDCETSECPEPFARLQSSDTTVTDSPTTTELTTPMTTATTQSTSPPTTKSNHLPYLSSRLSNDPAKPDVVVVTSLPVLIDLKNSRNNAVTDAPSWREVTVGVVRDHQGHPLKPRYNNWTAHLRSMKIKPENKFWNELTTQRSDMSQRSPRQQHFQQSQSQVNNAFWTDLQRQRPPAVPHIREKSTISSQPYMENPPRNYNAPKVNDFQVWRSQQHEPNSRWNMKSNNAYYAADDIYRMKSPMRNAPRNFEREESRPQQQWNSGNQRQLPRRW